MRIMKPRMNFVRTLGGGMSRLCNNEFGSYNFLIPSQQSGMSSGKLPFVF